MLLGGMLFLYVGSIGPVYAMAMRSGDTGLGTIRNWNRIESFYSPLADICETFPPLQWAIGSYVELWRQIIPHSPPREGEVYDSLRQRLLSGRN